MPATWTWVLGGIPPTGIEYRELTQATGRALTLRVDGPATAQFSLDGRGDEAAEIISLGTDLHVYRDGIKMFRGRIGPESDSINENEHRCQFTASDYRGMLDRRIIGATGRIFTAVDQGLIAWTLIADSQALPGGNWTITNGIGATSGVVRDRTYDPGKPVGEALGELGRVADGFEWDIDPTMSLRRWYPTRGASNNVILDYGGNVAKIERLLSPNDFANSVLVTGAQGLVPAAAAAGNVASDPRGLWERSLSTTYEVPAHLTSKATWMLAQTLIQRPEISVTLTPGRWGGLGVVGLGDTIRLSVQSGRLAIYGPHRVVEIVCVPGDDGTETITFGLIPVDEPPTLINAKVGHAHVGIAHVGRI